MTRKFYKTGNIIEVYTYEKYCHGKGGSYQHDEDFINSTSKDANYKNHCIRRLNTIRRIACSNFSNSCLFITLTFDDSKVQHDIKDVKSCNKVFKNFIKRLRYKINYNFKYLAVIEFQDENNRGAVHYHVLLDVQYIDFYDLTDIWGLGHVFINKIDNVDNVGAYIVKYILKDGGDKRLQGLPSYLHSKNVILPTSYLFDDKSYNVYSSCGLFDFLKSHKSVYETDYSTDLFGSVNYKQYNLTRS